MSNAAASSRSALIRRQPAFHRAQSLVSICTVHVALGQGVPCPVLVLPVCIQGDAPEAVVLSATASRASGPRVSATGPECKGGQSLAAPAYARRPAQLRAACYLGCLGLACLTSEVSP